MRSHLGRNEPQRLIMDDFVIKITSRSRFEYLVRLFGRKLKLLVRVLHTLMNTLTSTNMLRFRLHENAYR